VETVEIRTAQSSDSFFRSLIGDGRPPLLVAAGALAFAGGFALFLSATGDLLPQEVRYLGMTPTQLCAFADCRIFDFMVHDRAAWGGAMLGVAILWTWLVVFPLAGGQRLAWWTLIAAGASGFGSFVAYLSYTYIDAWHATGVALLLGPFVAGLVVTRRTLVAPVAAQSPIRPAHSLSAPYRLGWGILLLGALGTAGGGAMILLVGMTTTFVPEDLQFMGSSAAQVGAISERLIPLLAHDRIGFGGAVTTMGLTTAACLWFSEPSRHLFQAIALAGAVSLTAAIGIHFVVGYTSLTHLLPALTAAVALLAGLFLLAPHWLDDQALASVPR
jgi:hypothetical protein